MQRGDGRDAVLEVRDLEVRFQTKRGTGLAVNGVSLVLNRHETLGLVGESGSGKTITALSIIGLHPRPAATITGGRIMFRGEDLVGNSDAEWAKVRGAGIAFIPQDPLTSLNPVFTIGAQLAESLKLHTTFRGTSLAKRAVDLLQLLRIASPAERLHSYPHQLSGGMRQRVVGAIALAGEPEVLIADEPTTSLDATVQAAYLDLLQDIQQRTGTAILIITHDFSVVAQVCSRVAVMYAGRVVETAPTKELFGNPAHPYSQALIASVPDIDSSPRRLVSIEGQPPSIYEMPVGCPFAARCPMVMAVCAEQFPPTRSVGPSHEVSCWLHV